MAAADPSETGMLRYALDYLSGELPIFPVCSPAMVGHSHRDAATQQMVVCTGDKMGKTPLVRWRRYQLDLPSEDDVRQWWARWPYANIAMTTGELSGILVLDADGTEARKECLRRGGLDETPTVWTGKVGGAHFHLTYPGGNIRNFARKLAGTDMRAEGGYVLMPPSLHASGNRYRWADGTKGIPTSAIPQWLMGLIEGPDEAHSDDTATGDRFDIDEALGGFDAGQRDEGLFRFACRMRHDDTPQAYAEILIQEAAKKCRPPFGPAEAVEKVRRAYHDYEPGTVGPGVEFDEEFRAAGKTAPDPEPGFMFSHPISELMSMPYKDPDWMVDKLFTVGSNGWIGAEPKVGKSWLALELAYCLSTGQPFLGRFGITTPRRVLYIQEEDSIDRTHNRLQRLVDGDSLRPTPTDENFRYSIRSGFRLDNPVWIVYLRQDIGLFRPDVIILDVFNRLHGKDENKQQEMSEILAVLTGLTNQYGCAFIVVHHNRKPQQGNESRGSQSLRGSGVLGSWGECSLYIRPGKGKNEMIVTPESKDGPEMDDFTVTIEGESGEPIVLQISDVEAETRMPKGDLDVIDAVQRITGYGIGATVKAIADDLGKDRSTIQARLTRLVKAGYLTATAISSSHNPTIIYAVVL